MTRHNKAPGTKPFPGKRRLVPIHSIDAITPGDGGSGAGCRWLTATAETVGMPGTGPLGSEWPPLASTQAQDTDARGVRDGREFSRAALQRWGVTERCDDITTVVSELLTNALRHAVPGLGPARHGWPVRLGLLRSGPYLLCAVADPSSSAPVLKRPYGLAENGRGLHVVSALSDRWGYTPCAAPSGTGKVVWALFTAPPRVTLPVAVPAKGAQCAVCSA
jgi:hypothetical protein